MKIRYDSIKDSTPQELKAMVVKHWKENLERHLNGTLCRSHINGDNCAFCNTSYGENCQGCPVSEKTGSPGCHKTGYTSIYHGLVYKSMNHAGLKTSIEKFIAFLEALEV